MATDYTIQPKHVEDERTVHVGLRFKTYGSKEHVQSIKKRIERMLSVELGEAAEVHVYDLAGGGAVVEGLNIRVEEQGQLPGMNGPPVIPPGLPSMLMHDHLR